MIKHNFVSLETHSWTVANIALTIAREYSLPLDDQRLAWEYGLVHDAGWLNLKADFNHENADDKALKLLIQLIEERYPKFKGYSFKLDRQSLIEFASLHARSHHDKSIMHLLQSDAKKCVMDGDSLATGREVVGYALGRNVMRVFTTDLNYQTPHRRVNLARASEHYERLNQFHVFLSQIAGDISSEVGVLYDPIVNITDSIEYHLSSKDEASLRKRYNDWLGSRLLIGRKINIANTSLTRGKKDRCLFCGKDGYYYTRISKLTIFELESWFSGYRQKFGICLDCLAALAHFKAFGNVIVTPPKVLSEKLMDLERLRRILRKWDQFKAEGKCSVDNSYFDEYFWRESKLVSKVFESIDAKREAYEMSFELLDKTIDLLAMQRRGIFGAKQCDVGEIGEALKEATEIATICIDCIRIGNPDEIVIKGFTFPKYEGIAMLKLLSSIKRSLPLEKLRTFDEFLKEVALEMNVRELEVLEEKYDQVREVLMLTQ
jgi:hypothetical protein